MKYDREQLIKAILLISDEFGERDGYEAMISANFGFPTIVKSIIFQMFLNLFDSRSCSDELFNAYIVLFTYTTELNLKGSVDFKK